MIEEREEDIEFEQESSTTISKSVLATRRLLSAKGCIYPTHSRQNFEAVKEIAKNRKLDYVFDRSAEILVFHSEKNTILATLL